jgi:hypothetical protein
MNETIHIDALAHLPLRAILAYVARCVRRVQPLFRLDDLQPPGPRHARAIEALLRCAEEFARGAEPNAAAWDARSWLGAGRAARKAARHPAPVQVATAAVAAARSVCYAAQGPTDLVVVVAREAATAAKRALDERAVVAFRRAAARDYAALQRLRLGEYPEAGRAIDPSEDGPLGPLWPEGVPDACSGVTGADRRELSLR